MNVADSSAWLEFVNGGLTNVVAPLRSHHYFLIERTFHFASRFHDLNH